MLIILGFVLSTIFMIFTFANTSNFLVSIFASIFVFILINMGFYQLQKLKETVVRNANMTQINKMTGLEFEEYLRCLFKGLGYKVNKTNATNDYGADLVLIGNNEKIVVQAKRYKSSVGIKAVQEVLGAKSYYEADQAWVITNSVRFTKNAQSLAQKSNVRLIDKNGLIDLALKAGINLAEAQVIETDITPLSAVRSDDEHTDNQKCPKCNNEMVVRNSKNGQFYGCSTFPKCNGTRSIVKGA